MGRARSDGAHRDPRPLLARGRGQRLRGGFALALVLPWLVSACSEGLGGHPWLDLEGAPPHQIIEVSGSSQGQLVIVMNADVSPAEVMELGRRIREQAPPGAIVHARIFNDLQTARNWRTAPGEWTVEHLLAVVSADPETGVLEVRWVRPDPTAPGPATDIPLGSMDPGPIPDETPVSGEAPVPGGVQFPAEAPGPGDASDPVPPLP